MNLSDALDARKPWRERYEEYLASPAWKKKRGEVLTRAQHRCELCRCEGRLFVHHMHYKTLGHESGADLIALCGDCHELADDYRDDRPDFIEIRQACSQNWKTFHEAMSAQYGRDWWTPLNERAIVFWFMLKTGFLGYVFEKGRESA